MMSFDFQYFLVNNHQHSNQIGQNATELHFGQSDDHTHPMQT